MKFVCSHRISPNHKCLIIHCEGELFELTIIFHTFVSVAVLWGTLKKAVWHIFIEKRPAKFTSSMFQLLHDYLPVTLRFLGRWPMPELLFALCNGILFHARCMDMAHCPKFIIHMMDIATQNR